MANIIGQFEDLANKFATSSNLKNITAPFPANAEENGHFQEAVGDHFLLHPDVSDVDKFKALVGTPSLPTPAFSAYLTWAKRDMKTFNAGLRRNANHRTISHYLSLTQLFAWLDERFPFQLSDRQSLLDSIGSICGKNENPSTTATFIQDQVDKANDLIDKHNANLANNDTGLPRIQSYEHVKIIRDILIEKNNLIEYGNESIVNENVKRAVHRENFKTPAQFQQALTKIVQKAIPEADKGKLKFNDVLPTADQLSLNITREQAFEKTQSNITRISVTRVTKRVKRIHPRSDAMDLNPTSQKHSTGFKACERTNEQCYDYQNGVCRLWHPSQDYKRCKFGEECKHLQSHSYRCNREHSPDEVRKTRAARDQSRRNSNNNHTTYPITQNKPSTPRYTPTRSASNQSIEKELSDQQNRKTTELFSMEQVEEMIALKTSVAVAKAKAQHAAEMNAELRKRMKLQNTQLNNRPATVYPWQ